MIFYSYAEGRREVKRDQTCAEKRWWRWRRSGFTLILGPGGGGEQQRQEGCRRQRHRALHLQLRRLRSTSVRLRGRRRVRLEQAGRLSPAKPSRKPKSPASIWKSQASQRGGTQTIVQPKSSKRHQFRRLGVGLVLEKCWENADLLWPAALVRPYRAGGSHSGCTGF